MNKGDKVICIKDYTFQSRLINGPEYRYFAGKEYEIISKETSNSVYIAADLSKESIHKGINFDVTGTNKYFEKFDEYFMTLAEWRDKQINSILEDGTI